MNLIEFIFAIISKFVMIDERKLIRLQGDGNKWYNDNITVKKDEETTNPVFNILRKYGEEWYIQTAIACFYIFAVRWVADFMSQAGDDEPEQ